MDFKLPELKYNYAELEPHIDAKTMEIHHSKHHAGYTNNLNKAIVDTKFEGLSIEQILKQKICQQQSETMAEGIIIIACFGKY